MTWIIDNWSLLVVLACLGVCGFAYVKIFLNKPTFEQIVMLKEWLLWAVVQAERELKSNTGVLKLRMVYSLALEKFPALMKLISFELFSEYVDEALEQMKHLIKTNKSIENYIDLNESEK